MSDLISKQKLIEKMCGKKCEIPREECQMGLPCLMVDCVECAPTVDAVPVVRCGECRGWEPEKRKIHKCDICRMFGFEPDDFCSYGERKDDSKCSQ